MQSIQSKLAKVLSKKTKAVSGCREGTGYWLKQMNTLLYLIQVITRSLPGCIGLLCSLLLGMWFLFSFSIPYPKVRLRVSAMPIERSSWDTLTSHFPYFTVFSDPTSYSTSSFCCHIMDWYPGLCHYTEDQRAHSTLPSLSSCVTPLPTLTYCATSLNPLSCQVLPFSSKPSYNLFSLFFLNGTIH